ncbi:MAG: four helix bundle protein [Bacteroidetes bacterium]|nr:four helix bundle protein [Bacteroidota bacterium]
MEKYLKLEDISSYNISFDLSNYVWDIVIKWDSFAKYSIGKQFVDAADSISANIAEGFGRYFKKDKINFYRYGKGSAVESVDWNNKAIKRGLISHEQFTYIDKILNELPLEINNLIKYTNDKLKY